MVFIFSGLLLARPSVAAGPPPYITLQPADQSVLEGNPVSFTVAATSGTSLWYQWYQDGSSNGSPFLYRKLTSQTNSTLTISNVTFSNEGQYYVEVMNSGGTVTSRKATLVVVPNTALVASNDLFTTLEDVPLVVAAPGILANDAGTNGLSLSAVLVNNVTNGILSLAPDGSFTYTPTTNRNGSDCFTYRVTDGRAFSSVAKVTINITPVNDSPIAVNDTATVAEDGTVTVLVLSNDIDPEGAALVITSASTTNGSVTLVNVNTRVRFKPSANYNGTVNFSYTVSDGTNSSTANVTVTVTPVNDAPVAVNNAYATLEDVPLTVSRFSGILVNDSDVEGSPLTAVLVTNVTHGILSLSTDGSFTYTPAPNYYGTDSFTYRPNDGVALGDVATVIIVIMPANDQPVAVNDAYTTPEDVPLTVLAPGILANDTDVEGSPLSALLVSDVGHGSLSLNPDGSFTYQPATDFYGTDSFTYRVTDGAARVPVLLQESLSGGNKTEIRPDKSAAQSFRHGAPGGPDYSISKVRLRLSRKADAHTDLNFFIGTGINSDPVAGSDYAITIESITNTSDGSSFQDYDIVFAAPVGPFTAGTTYYLNLDNAPDGHGVFVETSGNNSYANGTYYEEGDDKEKDMRFQICTDDNSDLATVTITVNPVNDLPVANPESFDLTGGAPFSGPSVLANDTDAEHDAMTASLINGAAHGTLEFFRDGTFIYTPNSNFSGTDSFTYRCLDGSPLALPLTEGGDSFVTPDLGVTTVFLTVVNPNPNPGPVTIGAGVMTTAGLQLSLTGPSAPTYVIEASTNLTDWTAISTNSGLTGSVVFTDTSAASFSRRFYRAVAR